MVVQGVEQVALVVEKKEGESITPPFGLLDSEVPLNRLIPLYRNLPDNDQ